MSLTQTPLAASSVRFMQRTRIQRRRHQPRPAPTPSLAVAEPSVEHPFSAPRQTMRKHAHNAPLSLSLSPLHSYFSHHHIGLTALLETRGRPLCAPCLLPSVTVLPGARCSHSRYPDIVFPTCCTWSWRPMMFLWPFPWVHGGMYVMPLLLGGPVRAFLFLGGSFDDLLRPLGS